MRIGVQLELDVFEDRKLNVDTFFKSNTRDSREPFSGYPGGSITCMFISSGANLKKKKTVLIIPSGKGMSFEGDLTFFFTFVRVPLPYIRCW